MHRAGFHTVKDSTNVKYINNALYAVSTNSSVVAHNTNGYDPGSSSYSEGSHDTTDLFG
jgi:hypothetical protein